jgi:hypothetical protein
MTAPMIALITDNLPGNVHQAASLINVMDVADKVVSLEFSGGSSTVVYRVERMRAKKFLEQTGQWRSLTDQAQAMYDAWARGLTSAKLDDFPHTPPGPLYVPTSWKE